MSCRAETKHILQQLRPQYEEFHQVIYDETALDFAVDASYKYVNDRFLPDKAIDLIDEAGAASEVSDKKKKKEIVTKADIADILAKTCKVDSMAMKAEEDNSELETLTPPMPATNLKSCNTTLTTPPISVTLYIS